MVSAKEAFRARSVQAPLTFEPVEGDLLFEALRVIYYPASAENATDETLSVSIVGRSKADKGVVGYEVGQDMIWFTKKGELIALFAVGGIGERLFQERSSENVLDILGLCGPHVAKKLLDNPKGFEDLHFIPSSPPEVREALSANRLYVYQRLARRNKKPGLKEKAAEKFINALNNIPVSMITRQK